MTKWIAAVFTGWTLLMATATYAQGLTGETVSRFIESMEELQANEVFSSDFMAAWEASRQAESAPTSLMLSEAVMFLQDRDGYATLETVVENHGFRSPETWGAIGDRALLALTRLDLADNIAGLQQKLVKMREDVNNNDRFSGEQKERMLGMIDNTEQMLDRVGDVPSEDLDAVRPHQSELKQVLEYDPGK